MQNEQANVVIVDCHAVRALSFGAADRQDGRWAAELVS